MMLCGLDGCILHCLDIEVNDLSAMVLVGWKEWLDIIFM